MGAVTVERLDVLFPVCYWFTMESGEYSLSLLGYLGERGESSSYDIFHKPDKLRPDKHIIRS